jgi:hypothetical protein
MHSEPGRFAENDDVHSLGDERIMKGSGLVANSNLGQAYPDRYDSQYIVNCGKEDTRKAKNPLLIMFELVTFAWDRKGTREGYVWGIQSTGGIVRKQKWAIKIWRFLVR